MKSSRLIVYLLLLVALPVYAGYRMKLVAEFELPENDCWDVQHWTSDSTYGWVTGNDDEITYCLDINEPEIVTFEVDFEFDSVFTYDFRGIKHVKINGADAISSPEVVVMFEYSYNNGFEVTALGFARVSITTQQEILPQCGSLIVNWWSDDGTERSSSIKTLYVWPPAPFRSTHILWSIGTRYTRWGMVYDYESLYPSSGAFSLLGDSASFSMNPGGINSPFAYVDSMIIVGVGAGISRRTDFYGNCTQSTESQRILYRADSLFVENICQSYEQSCSDQTCLYLKDVATQISADGSRRIFFSTDTCFVDSAGCFIPAWTNPEIAGWPLYTATLHDSPDERLLRKEGNMLYVFDAEDGNCLGVISGFQGSFKYILKQPNHVSEFVTYDGSTVRIYKPADAFTLHVLPATNSLQLNWNPVTGASSYTVWLRHPPPMTGPYFAGTTTDTTLTIPIPEESVGYFNVETDY